MKRATTLSLTLNVLLAGWLGWLSWLAWRGPRSASRRAISIELNHRVLRSKLQIAPVRDGGPASASADPNQPFTWAQLESSNYRIYLANLRAIGCPEPTVRDLITADVNDLFAARVKTLLDAVTGRFWDLVIRPRELEIEVQAAHAQLNNLAEERNQLFLALFKDSDPFAAEQLEQAEVERREGWDRLADFLPEEKRARFVAASDAGERAWTEYLKTADPTSPKLPAQRQEFDAAQQTALGEWLTPQELGELRVRNSGGASLRERLAGLDFSEAETRRAAQLQMAADEARARWDPSGTQIQEHALRELLGAERYQAFRRATDDRFGPMYRVTQRLELPDTVAAQAYDIRLQAEDAARQMKADSELTVEERRDRLQILNTATRQLLSTALSEQGLAAYEKLDGDWLRQIPVTKP